MVTEHGFHSSGRFSRKMSLLERSVDRLRHMKGMSLGSGTEASARGDAMLKFNKGWEFEHISRHDAPTHAARECWAMWKSSVWEQVDDALVPVLSPMTFHRSKAYGGHEAPPFRLLIVPLRHIASKTLVDFCVAHMSLDNTELRSEIWLDQADGGVEIMRDRKRLEPRRRFIWNADWNKNYREAKERAAIRNHVAKPLGAVQAWDAGIPRHGGTHGPRGLIDGTVTDLPGATARLLSDDRSSDHRPYGFAVHLPRPTHA